MELLACCVPALSASARPSFCGEGIRQSCCQVQPGFHNTLETSQVFVRKAVMPVQADAIIANPVCYGHIHGERLTAIQEGLSLAHTERPLCPSPCALLSVVAPLTLLYAAAVAEKLQVPLHMVFTMPWTPTGTFPHPMVTLHSLDTSSSPQNCTWPQSRRHGRCMLLTVWCCRRG